MVWNQLPRKFFQLWQIWQLQILQRQANDEL